MMLRVVTVRTGLRKRRRLRFRYWLMRRRLGPFGRAIADDHARALDDAFIFGRKDDNT